MNSLVSKSGFAGKATSTTVAARLRFASWVTPPGEELNSSCRRLLLVAGIAGSSSSLPLIAGCVPLFFRASQSAIAWSPTSLSGR